MTHEIIATYRVQLRSDFGFDDAAGIAGYLTKLGVSHLYCSPYLQASPGSTHGYDVVDHHEINQELGGSEGHQRFTGVLRSHGLGQVLDIVPNHMAVGPVENRWWWDVLENGPSSRYASYFDVDWDPPEERLRNSVLLPVLGDHYGRVLEAGELKVVREGGAFALHYYEHQFPLAPRSLHALLLKAAERCNSDMLAFLADAYRELPGPAATDLPSVERRHRDKEVLRSLLVRLCEDDSNLASAVDSAIEEMNRDYDALDIVIEHQNYRLAFWRTAARDLGYRRFFDINTLVGLRAEDERVFSDTHRLILKLAADGVIDGLRVDHPDGLRDPEAYLRRLNERCEGKWIIVEKILEPQERLLETWPVAGTTGYEFLNRLGGLFIDPEGEDPLTLLYSEYAGAPADFLAVSRAKKRLVLRDLLGSDLYRLAVLLGRICEQRRRYRDYTRVELGACLEEVISCFPVYRTYIRAAEGWISEADIGYIAEALETARESQQDVDHRLFDFIGELLTLRVRGELESEFVMRFQQLTGPAAAKGIEDTAFYSYNRLVCLNEVGNDPARFCVSPDQFHQSCQEAQMHWPLGMVTTSTHDTKRSEDVRARIGLLSEIPKSWGQAVWRWTRMTDQYRQDGLPDRNTQYLLFQTLVGAWPIKADRLLAYMEKACREAKTHTSWTNIQKEYEEAVADFVRDILADRTFSSDLEKFVNPLIRYGRITSLAQVLIKLTAPGIPDTYQGTELWDSSLVDPDNRRPVDYDQRRRLLDKLDSATPEEVLDGMDDGLPKLWVIRQALALRRQRSELFGRDGEYQPIKVAGRKASHAVAFARGGEAITVAPRLVIGLAGDWEDTTVELPAADWYNHLTGEIVAGGVLPVADLLERFPAALLSH